MPLLAPRPRLLTALVGVWCIAWIASCSDATAPDTRADLATAAPASVSMNADTLAAADRHIRDELPNVNAFLVVRHGKVVIEKYYNGKARNSLLQVRSVTKSVVGALTGIALERGWLDSLQQPLYAAIPDYFDSAVPLERRAITVQQLLTMSTGLAHDSLGHHPIVGSWLLEYLQGPSIGVPGAQFLYDSSNPHLLSAAITRRAHMPLTDIAKQTLFGPLAITSYTWGDEDPEGYTNGATGLELRAQDQAKLGQLYLQNGMWNGQRILPDGWAAASTLRRFGGQGGGGYGYLWWVVGGLNTEVYAALGFRQQFIIVVPEFDIVMIVSSETDNLRGPERDHFHLLNRYVLAAVEDQPSNK